MARIRSVKPEFFTHPDIIALSIPARLLFISMLTQADDYGRLYDQATKIRGEAFGPEDKVNIGKLLDELTAAGRVIRYEAQGRRCIRVENFLVHQRVSHPTPSRIPPDPLGNGSGGFHEALQTSHAPAEQGAGSRELDLSQELPPGAPEYEDTKIPSGWSEPEAGLVRKLIEVDPIWEQLTPPRINALNRDFGKPIVTVALQHMLEERNVPLEAYPMLRAVCLTVKTTAEAEVTSA